MNICLALDTQKQKAVECAGNIAKMLIGENVCVLMLESSAAALWGTVPDGVKTFCEPEELFEQCDYAVTVGGDGIIIHIAKYASQKNVPLIGVNVGRVGFAAEIETYEYMQLKKILAGDFSVQERMLLSACVRKKDEIQEFCCINEAVISRGSLSKILDLSVSLNGKTVSKYRADGLIFATATGSTAYSLSAGGPVVDPEMDCIVLTPVCPYSLSARCVVLSGDSVLSVSADNLDRTECYLTVDGRESVRIGERDEVTVKRAPYTLKMINLKNKNFLHVVNEKLGTGE